MVGWFVCWCVVGCDEDFLFCVVELCVVVCVGIDVVWFGDYWYCFGVFL